MTDTSLPPRPTTTRAPTPTAPPPAEPPAGRPARGASIEPGARARADTLRDFYEYEADTYHIDEESEVAWKHRRDLVRRMLPKERLDAFLDVGCGDGALSLDLHGALDGTRAFGCELSLRRVVRAGADKRDVRFTGGSIYELPFATDAVPLVVCTDLLEHLDEPEQAFKELARVSSKWVLVTTPYCIDIEKTLCPHCGDDYFLYGHQHSFGREGMQKLADAAGARVERYDHMIPLFECRRYKWFPPLKWLVWSHFKNTGTLGALFRVD